MEGAQKTEHDSRKGVSHKKFFQKRFCSICFWRRHIPRLSWLSSVRNKGMKPPTIPNWLPNCRCLLGLTPLFPTVNSQVFVVGVLPDACLWKCLVRVRVVCCFWLLAGAMAKKRPAASRAGADTDSQRQKTQGPEHAEVAAAQAVRYNTPYDQLLTCSDSGATMARLRAFRAFQEFSVADLQKMCAEGATGVSRQRCFFVASDEAVKDCTLVWFISLQLGNASVVLTLRC